MRRTHMPNIMEITDFASPELDLYAKLSEAQLLHYHEPIKKGLFIAENPKVIERALNAGYIPNSLLSKKTYYRRRRRHYCSLWKYPCLYCRF